MTSSEQVAFVILTLPSDELVLQRRREHTHFGNHLGFYGGAVEGDETPIEALHRELKEETDVVSNELHLEQIDVYQLEVSQGRNLEFYVFLGRLGSFDFRDNDGGSPEKYTLDELMLRDDLTPGSRMMVERLMSRSTNGIKPN